MTGGSHQWTNSASSSTMKLTVCRVIPRFGVSLAAGNGVSRHVLSPPSVMAVYDKGGGADLLRASTAPMRC